MLQVKILADSKYKNHRLTTFEVVYPKPIHPEMLRHRAHSRTVESSRAKPVHLFVDAVRTNPYIPWHITLNEKGMCGKELTDPKKIEEVTEFIKIMGAWNAQMVEYLANNYGLHKQVLNRYLEPYLYTKEVISGTEWNNFFKLRTAKDAEPHIQDLANLMLKTLNESEPKEVKEGYWHLPYVTAEERDLYKDVDLRKVSAARCARCSYKAYDGSVDIQKDIDLFQFLYDNYHMSPMEHVACASNIVANWTNSNYRGWVQLRKTLPFDSWDAPCFNNRRTEFQKENS